MSNNASELARVCELVRGFAHEHRLNRRAAYRLELSVNEALANIISYAYRDDVRHDIVVELNAQAYRIRVEIEDDGVAFNPLELPTQGLPATLEKSRTTGRGIPLMLTFMDEVHYLRRDNTNVLTMVLQR